MVRRAYVCVYVCVCVCVCVYACGCECACVRLHDSFVLAVRRACVRYMYHQNVTYMQNVTISINE